MRRHLANIITLSRLLLMVPWSICVMADSSWALAVMALIIATDIIDGPIARRLKTAGPLGGALDAGCDAAVCFAAAVLLGLSDTRYLAAAALMAASFLSWMALGRIEGGQSYTRLGRYNGAACYALILAASALQYAPAAARSTV